MTNIEIAKRLIDIMRDLYTKEEASHKASVDGAELIHGDIIELILDLLGVPKENTGFCRDKSISTIFCGFNYEFTTHFIAETIINAMNEFNNNVKGV